MPDVYLAPEGSDSASGTAVDPWATIGRAVAQSAQNPLSAPFQAMLQPGTYQATNVALTHPISLVGLGPGVVVEPTSSHDPWWVNGTTIWETRAINLPAGKRITQATWHGPDGKRHRVPVWNPLPPLDTPDKWAAAVLSTANPHTRWGLYSTSTDLYLIPPADWTDPNTVKILVGWSHAFQINGPGITLQNLEFAGHATAVRLDAFAANAHLADLRIFGGQQGIAQYGAVGPLTYGHDHLIERVAFSDNGTCIREGDPPPIAGQGISWNLVKNSAFDMGIKDATGKPLLVHKALTSSETCAILDYGGSKYTTIQDCTVDGYFDGFDSWDDGRYDATVDANLIVRRCTFANITDDALDRSRNQANVTFEDCTFRNVGTVLSPAPLWGSITMRRCQGSMIGEQVRILDGLGHRPPGSVVKYGAIDPGHPQGSVTLDECTFWSDTATTQGLCPDGGDGPLVPKFALIDTTIRVPYIVLNWGATYPHPVGWLSIAKSTLSSSGTRPLKVQPSITSAILTPSAAVDARYYNPSAGDFSDMAIVTDLQAQLAEAQAARQRLEAAVDTAIAALSAVVKP